LASRKEQREEARRQREEREAEERRKQRRTRRLWQVGAITVAVVAVVVVAILVSSSGGDDTKVQATEGRQTRSLFSGIDQSDLTLGSPEAKVTLYEFADLQCPFCKQYTKTAFPQIVEKYVKTGKIKMVWRNLTFIGPDSVTAARAASAAGQQDKLWDFQDLFYANQGTENTGYVTDKFIEDIAKQIPGLDVNKLKADMSAPTVEQQLGEAQTQAQEFGINSTPSFLLQVGNGKPTKLDVQNFKIEEFSRAIDKALQEAEGT
jgi:protein-disulfide isomerase